MIGTLDIRLNAANPQIPLRKVYAIVGSPSQIRIIDAPKQIGAWKLTKVYVTANNPDNASVSSEAVLTGGCWHATIAASSVAGKSVNGFRITADGVGEDGTTAVTGYVLGVGDFEVLNSDSTVTVGTTTYYLHYLPSVPATKHIGDCCVVDGAFKWWNGVAWQDFGSGGDVKRSDFVTLQPLGTPTLNAVKSLVNDILDRLKNGPVPVPPSSAALCAALLAVSAALLPSAAVAEYLTPETQFGNIYASSTIREIVSASGVTNEPPSYAMVSNAAVTALHEHQSLAWSNDYRRASVAIPWADVTHPAFATVATSGSYTDLTNKPTIPAAYTDAQAGAVATNVSRIVVGDATNVIWQAIGAANDILGAALGGR